MPIGIYKRTKEHNKKISIAKKGKPAWNKGKKMSKEQKIKISSALLGRKLSKEHRLKIGKSEKGEKHFAWKGENASYRAVHSWISKWKGKPKMCEMCGTIKNITYHWANIDHKYRRVLDDYIRLCVKCHRKYDKIRKMEKTNY